MSFPISISKSSEELPVDPLLVLTRTAIGLGLGILMADKIKPPVRQATAIALLAIGALAAAPWLVKITVGQINRPSPNGAAAPVCVRFAAIPATPQTTTFIRVCSPMGNACARAHNHREPGINACWLQR